MPNTRASTSRLASKRKLSQRGASTTSDVDSPNSIRRAREDIEAEIGLSVMDQLTEVRSGVEELYTRIQSLKQENRGLRSELQHVQHDADRGSRSRERASQRQIQSLERTIIDLKAAREKDKRTIEKFRETEIQRDANELADDHDRAVPAQQTIDLGENATKLLRCLCDTIDMNTLAEGEECAICMEEMAVEECYSLSCRHPVCVECFKQLGDRSNTMPNCQTGSVQCPHCREVCPREECEIITHTAVQQWDLLLDISRQWAAVDIGGMDIGEDDDDEDGSMDDGSVAATKSPCLPETLGKTVTLDPETSTVSTLPNDTGPVAYKSLPSTLKRKRLTELVAQRGVKQRV